MHFIVDSRAFLAPSEFRPAAPHFLLAAVMLPSLACQIASQKLPPGALALRSTVFVVLNAWSLWAAWFWTTTDARLDITVAMLASYYLVKSAVWMFIQPASSSSLGGRLQDLLITGWGRAVAEVPCDGKQPAAKRTNVKNPPSDGLYIVKQVFLIGLQYFIYDAMFYMIKVARSFTKSDPDSYFWRLALGYLCGQFVLFNMVVAGQIMHTVLVLAFGTRNSMFDELFISPNLSSSPRDLWSRRWHRAFRTVWVMVGFKPVHQWLLPRFGDRVGRAGGVLAVFLISGACHAYITSASFHDYDLMSIRFFVLQGIVVIVEELWRETLAYRALTQSLPPWLLELSAIVSMHLFIAVCSQDFIGPYERHLVESGRMPFSLVSGLLEAYPQQQAVI